ncbi:hypothetical protein BGZ80_005588 [Entomortierella chlamydospora]|uniref:Uncharacterized protein n=1 Tax=Entomortierella chlamydospora TaxID=101097 RepID=A0A9P6MJC5_9FUNG|nr:hypothetical protein BGZ79_004001 [Entomortierella chlamydospora]KAG0004631.1 hypothetical protein BGZ80_005588 [Entomortierella chlamydospora]
MHFLRVVLPRRHRSAGAQQLRTHRGQYRDRPYDEMRKSMDLLYTTEVVPFLEKRAEAQALEAMKRIKTKICKVAVEEAKKARVTCHFQDSISDLEDSIEKGLKENWRKDILAFYDLSDDDFAELQELRE